MCSSEEGLVPSTRCSVGGRWDSLSSGCLRHKRSSHGGGASWATTPEDNGASDLTPLQPKCSPSSKCFSETAWLPGVPRHRALGT